MSSPTPGPWFGVKDSLAGPDGVVVYDEKRGRVLAHVFVGDAEREANAHLIGAAPDLLAVVEAFESEHLRGSVNPLVLAARAALKKARGQ